MPAAAGASIESPQALAAEISRFLEAARAALDDEIRHYPTPIPRCDAQFNHLYEQRSRLARALDAVHETDEQAAAFVRAFAAAAPFSDSDAERALRSRACRTLGPS
jgi:hypothetical protein